MRKSTIATLIVAICLIALGFILVGAGVAASYDKTEYHFGPSIYFESTFTTHTLQSRLLTTFGQMSFLLGIAGVFLFAYLAIRNPKERKEAKSGHEANQHREANHSQERPYEPVRPRPARMEEPLDVEEKAPEAPQPEETAPRTDGQ